MTPACSMDDVPDPEMRKLLCDYMYTTEWRKAEIEGASGFKAKVPNISTITSKDTVIGFWLNYKALLLISFCILIGESANGFVSASGRENYK